MSTDPSESPEVASVTPGVAPSQVTSDNEEQHEDPSQLAADGDDVVGGVEEDASDEVADES